IFTSVYTEALSMSCQNEILKVTEDLAFQLGMALPTQVILKITALANFLILLTTVFPSNMIFVPRRPLSDLQCKLEYYIHLVARDTSLCSMCVLSIYQFVTLVPGNWGRVMLRGSAQGTVGYSCCACWLFSLLDNIYIPMKVTGPQNTLNGTDFKRKWIFSTSNFNIGMASLRFAHDTVSICLMVWTSASMVILLHRYHQRLKHIHTPSHPETRATHTIILLVVTFVSFYVLDCIWFCLNMSVMNSHLWLRCVSELLITSFPTVSSIILIIRDPRDPCSVL
uniref:Vomeronasal type-1 receptor n=1 Tax=Nannospalax galili TaxID=1026970 RepID=A0A8C6QAV9_NANGA